MKFSFLFYLSTVAALCACGGSTPPPQPLRHNFDESYIAQVGMSEREAELVAQNQYNRARTRFLKAEADFKASKTNIAVAKNARQQALSEEKSAQIRMKAAEDSGDMNRINAARAEVRAAELERRAADDKVAALVAHSNFLKAFEYYAQEEMFRQEALYELAKAKIAKKSNIRPKGFELETYKNQAEARVNKVKQRKATADAAKAKADAAKLKWTQRKREAAEARARGKGSARQ